MKTSILVLLLSALSAYNCANVAMDTKPPLMKNGTQLSLRDVPQFVMVSFDDAITYSNFQTYKEIFNKRNKKNGCPIQASFFIVHENTNYQLVNDLYRRGHEIGVKTLTHAVNTDYWKKANKSVWVAEVSEMRRVASLYANIPESEIQGFRASYLQTGGNVTFQVLQDQKFRYDSSMPTLTYSKPAPIYPYTLDHGFTQDCQINPCPTYPFPGLWEVPIIDYWKKRLIIDGDGQNPPIYSDSPCSMADFCLPSPETTEETFQYFKTNFDRHYATSKAPFPVFLHESFLADPVHKQGYLEFIDYLNALDDVYMVSIQEVVNWMENPVPLSEYVQSKCVRTVPESSCPSPGTNCNYYKVPVLSKSDKQMVICGKDCPPAYPWLHDPYGYNVQ